MYADTRCMRNGRLRHERDSLSNDKNYLFSVAVNNFKTQCIDGNATWSSCNTTWHCIKNIRQYCSRALYCSKEGKHVKMFWCYFLVYQPKLSCMRLWKSSMSYLQNNMNMFVTTLTWPIASFVWCVWGGRGVFWNLAVNLWTATANNLFIYLFILFISIFSYVLVCVFLLAFFISYCVGKFCESHQDVKLCALVKRLDEMRENITHIVKCRRMLGLVIMLMQTHFKRLLINLPCALPNLVGQETDF